MKLRISSFVGKDEMAPFPVVVIAPLALAKVRIS
jgi:hypothetical protein